MQRLWTCPNPDCDEPAVRAPSKPRRDDIRRYCLRCSTKTGRLVPRVCPSLEKEREEKAAKAKGKAAVASARAKEKKQKEKAEVEARHTVNGVDVPSLMPSFWNALNKAADNLKISHYLGGIPHLRITRTRINPAAAHGKGGPATGVKLVLGEKADPVRIEELLLHEMCHVLLGRDRFGDWHGPDFCKTLMEAARILWGVEVAYVIGGGGRVYILDDLIMKEMWKARGLPEGPTGWIARHQRIKADREARKVADPQQNTRVDQAD